MSDRDEDVSRYLHLTRDEMPRAAQGRGWPVVNDHCFQRIVLDNLCGGVWYDHLDRPAYRHLSAGQARAAVRLCEGIMDGVADLAALNRNSLRWRGKMR